METNNYKTHWTEQDFDLMGWHDSKIYSINFDMDNHRIIFDIDYIFDWIKNPDTVFPFGKIILIRFSDTVYQVSGNICSLAHFSFF